MKTRHALSLLLVIALLVIAWRIQLAPKINVETFAGDDKTGQRGTVTVDPRQPAARANRKSSRDRSDAAYIKSLTDLTSEFDEILPARFPEEFSSLCDANLKAGEALFLGGFKTSNGNYEFTTLQIEPDAHGESSGAYRVSAKTLCLSPEQCAEAGLSELLSTAKMRIQKAVVLSAAAMSQMGPSASIMSMPSVTTSPNTAVSISVGTDSQAHVISLIVSQNEDDQSMRIRTRIESPTDVEK